MSIARSRAETALYVLDTMIAEDEARVRDILTRGGLEAAVIDKLINGREAHVWERPE